MKTHKKDILKIITLKDKFWLSKTTQWRNFSQQRRLKDGKKNLTQAFKSPVTASRICWILTLFFLPVGRWQVLLSLSQVFALPVTQKQEEVLSRLHKKRRLNMHETCQSYHHSFGALLPYFSHEF